MKHIFSVKVGPASFRIGSEWRAIIDHLENLYAAYPKPQLNDFTIRLESNSFLRKYIRPSVMINGDYMLPEAAPLPFKQGLLAAEMAMNLQMALGWYRHLILHASSVEKDGKVIIMTGESGSGKSTLSAILGQRGWRFMGDEFAFLDCDSGDAIAYPRLISLKNEAIATLHKEAPNAHFGPLMKDTPKGDIQHMVPPADAIRRMDQRGKPVLLLYPSYGYDTMLTSMLQSENFIRLTQASTNLVVLGERGFDTLSRFVQNVPAFTLDYQHGDEAIDIIDKLWEQL